MINRSTKLRWRRRLKRGQRKVEVFSVKTEEGAEKYFFKRIPRLTNVWRFVAGWVTLLILLSGGVFMQLQALSPYYQTIQPTKGGIYTEGLVGRFTTANPMYATTAVDSSVSRLVFSSLLKYNSQNQLVGDLASKIEADDRGLVYKVTLKDDIFWHDGKPVTPEDVIFTYQSIQNPDAKSPLQANWSSVKLQKIDNKTISFTLPHPLASFKPLLTNGIVPKHKLDKLAPSQLRTAEFNTMSPIGSGPFMWDSIQISGQSPETREEQIGLSANTNYYDGEPNLDKFIIKAIHSEKQLVEQFNKQQVDAMAGIDKRPDSIGDNGSISEYSIPLNAEIMVFFKTTSEALQEKAVRQALTLATNRAEVVSGLGYPVASARGPLLSNHLGYASEALQLDFNLDEANKILDKEGWVKGEDGVRKKGEQKLEFRLVTLKNSEYSFITQTLQRQWKQVGASIDISLEEDKELQSVIALHTYDALLYGVTLGSDPDVYAYWHSSQADVRSSSRLNFSELKSSQVDSALEAGRTRLDPTLRAAKYKPFLTAWRDEAPAVALYQPRYLYITRGRVYGIDSKNLDTATDRYANVQNWRIRTEHVTIQ